MTQATKLQDAPQRTAAMLNTKPDTRATNLPDGADRQPYLGSIGIVVVAVLSVAQMAEARIALGGFVQAETQTLALVCDQHPVPHCGDITYPYPLLHAGAA